MAQQAVVVYISQEGGEITDLEDLIGGAVAELDWVGSLNGEDIPIKVRLSEVDPDEEWPEEPEHDYVEYDTPAILRDHLVEHHAVVPQAARTLFEAGDNHLDNMHQMLHGVPEEDGA